ncbi:hypothetical protein HYX02_07030 [Candidatus Woesearchaeota archaeon]|nr:hypothetical protein [Candidatus Woesearchaeota archaeon]
MVSQTRHDTRVEGGAFEKSFVRYCSPILYSTEPFVTRDVTGFQGEIAGYDFLRHFFPVPARIGIHPDRLIIQYEFLSNHQRLDELVKGIITLQSMLGANVHSNVSQIQLNRLYTQLEGLCRELGRKLRSVHGATIERSGASYNVRMVEDFIDENVMVPNGSLEMKLIDFESFGEVETHKNLVVLPTSILVTALQSGGNDKAIIYLQKLLESYFKGYFEQAPQWPIGLIDLQRQAYSYAIWALRKPFNTHQNAALISQIVGRLASKVVRDSTLTKIK